MKNKIKSLVLALYKSNRIVLKELGASFLKAFLAVFLPALLGILSELSKLGTGGNIHLSFLLSLLVSGFVGAVYAGVHAASKVLKDWLKSKVGA